MWPELCQLIRLLICRLTTYIGNESGLLDASGGDEDNQEMAIKSATFGRVELSGDDAARFIRHMSDDNAVPAAQATLGLGRALLARKSAADKPASTAKLVITVKRGK